MAVYQQSSPWVVRGHFLEARTIKSEISYDRFKIKGRVKQVLLTLPGQITIPIDGFSSFSQFLRKRATILSLGPSCFACI